MSNADLLQLIAVLVGIFAILVVPNTIHLDRQQRELARANEQIAETLKGLENQRNTALEMCNSLANICRCLSQETKFHRDILESVVAGGAASLDSRRLGEVWRENDEEVIGHLTDLAVFSPVASERESSFKHLAEDIGDVESLRKMRIVAASHPNLSVYCELLERRLIRRSSFRRS